MTTILPASAVPVDNVDDGGRRRQLDLAVDDHPETSRKQRVVGAGDGQLWTGDVHTQRKTQKRRQAWITCTCRRLWSAASRGTNNDAETSTSRRAAALGSSPTGKDVDDCYEDKQDDQNDDVDDKVWTYPEGGRGWFVVFVSGFELDGGDWLSLMTLPGTRAPPSVTFDDREPSCSLAVTWRTA